MMDIDKLAAVVADLRKGYDALDPRVRARLRDCRSHEEVLASAAYGILIPATTPLKDYQDPHPSDDSVVPLLVMFRWVEHQLDPDFAFGETLRKVSDKNVFPSLEQRVRQAMERRLDVPTRAYHITNLLKMVDKSGLTVDWGRLGAELLTIFRYDDTEESNKIKAEWARRLWEVRYIRGTFDL